MKTLTLLRHAKSSWDDPVARDFDRPLNKRGRRAARAVGREMREQKLEFDLVIASPAARVVETLEDVAEGYGREFKLKLDERIYLASPEVLLDLIRHADDNLERLMLVGHNPGLERLALLLTHGHDGDLRLQLREKYPTGSLAEIALPIDHWDEAGQGSGTLKRFIRPRDLDPSLGPDETS
jgi:phosphohistidine phosphatase